MAKFSCYQDNEFVWSYVKNLKGTRIGICNYFPREVDEIHAKLYPVLKRAKQNGQSAFFKLDKLTDKFTEGKRLKIWNITV